MPERRHELYDCKIIIHGRFHLKSDETFVHSEAYAYVHMNNQERMKKQAISDKAMFKFYEDYLRVCKRNVFSSVEEKKYRYTDIEKYYVFADYPGIVVFCIMKPNYRLGFLFECTSEAVANKICNIVEDQKRKQHSLPPQDDGAMSDGTSDRSTEYYPRRGPPNVYQSGTFDRGSPVDSSPRDGPGILKSGSFERQPLPSESDDDFPRRRNPAGPRGDSGRPMSAGPGSYQGRPFEKGSPLNSRRSPAADRPKSLGPGSFRSGAFGNGSPTNSPDSASAGRPSSAGPGSFRDGTFGNESPYSGRRSHSPNYGRRPEPGRPIINVSYDRNKPATPRQYKGKASPKNSRDHGGRHKQSQRSASYSVGVLGRYRVNDPRKDFNVENAQSYLRVCLNNPPSATDKGELQLYSDCMKLMGIDSGHYDYNKIHRIYSFDDDPLVVIFGVEDKTRHIFMLLRFRNESQINEAVRFITHKTDEKDTPDFTLSDWPRGTTYTANGGSSLDRMSKTIALPTQREIEAKRYKRQSQSSASIGSRSEVEEETITGIRHHGDHAAVTSATSSGRDYGGELTKMMSSIEREQSDNSKYIDSVIIDDRDATRTTSSVMYFEEEKVKRSTNARQQANEQVITRSVNTRVHSSIKPTIKPYLDPSDRRGSMQWIEEASYIDYKPGEGAVEADTGPVYMYCARQVRKDF